MDNIYQNNLNDPYISFNEDIEIDIIVNPLIFYHDYDRFKYYDNGKKILAPKYLLYKLSKYNDIEYPIHIRINNTLFTIHDFYEDIDCLYIPTPYFYNINLIENQSISITILKNIPEKATFLKLKPMTDELYEIENIKKYLEIHLSKLYASIHKDEVIKVPYKNNYIEFTITDCKPENIVSLNEIEELTIELEPPMSVESDNIEDAETEPNDDINKEKNTFPGKGQRLCD
jgi:hypothetical protein